MTDVRDYGQIGFDRVGDHFGTAQSDLFLYGIRNVKSERKFLVVLLEQPRYLCDHKAAHPVVQGPANEVVLVQDHKLIGVGDHTSDMYAKLLDLFLLLATHIDEYVLQFGGFFLASDRGR